MVLLFHNMERPRGQYRRYHMEEKNPIQVADRLFGTLEMLVENGSAGLKEVSERMELNKSTAHRILNSLVCMGYVKQNETSGKYEPTFKLVDMAGKIMDNTDIVYIARPCLRRLMEQAQETVHFVERDGVDAVYIDKVESMRNGIQLISRIGSRIPLYCSGVGKAIAAYMEEAELEKMWKNSRIRALTPYTVTDFAAYKKELEDVRNKGYALDNEENERGVRCIAVSLREHTGRRRYAFSISAPVSRMDAERVRSLAGYILETKRQIERKINGLRA